MAGNKMGAITRQKILAAAQEEFLEMGFDGARVDEIARRAGVTKMMLYYHFNTKQNIFDEIVQKTLAEIKQELQTNLARLEIDNLESFRSLIMGMVGFYMQRREVIRLLLGQYFNGRSPAAENLAVFNDVLEVILTRGGFERRTQEQVFLVRMFFFNALPMLMYACLSEKFCADFAIDPANALEAFSDMFVRTFYTSAAAGAGPQ